MRWFCVFLLAGLLVCSVGTVEGTTRYVSEGQSIQAAIDWAVGGDEIAVREGVYLEAINFKGKAIRVYSVDGPGVTTIDGTGHLHVVECSSGEGADTVLEGFTITGGDADGEWPNYIGGGMYCEGSSPTVTDCVFTDNSAVYGGGMGSNNLVQVLVENFSFELPGAGKLENWNDVPGWSSDISADASGVESDWPGSTEGIYSGFIMSGDPAVWQVTDHIISSGEIFVLKVDLQDNWSDGLAEFAMALYYEVEGNRVMLNTMVVNPATQGEGGWSEFTLTWDAGSGGAHLGRPIVIEFMNISSVLSWVGIDNVRLIVGGEGLGNDSGGPTVTNCTFNGNNADIGGAMYNDGSSPMISDCNFLNNDASASGGGMFNYNSSPTVTDCMFTNNRAVAWNGGGIINAANSSPTVTNCVFQGNSASSGGGMANYDNSNPQVVDCMFRGNWADNSGGGMLSNASSATVTNCVFEGNSASLGGGIRNEANSSPTVTNCVFQGNSAVLGGGMANFDNSNPLVTNCTLSGNSTFTGRANAMLNGNSSPTATNCIFWGNGFEQILDDSSSTTVSYSDIEGGWTGEGGNNINEDPGFVDPNDLRLLPGSPCIDAGDSRAIVEFDLDIEGNKRVVDDPDTPDSGVAVWGLAVDMGAYELTVSAIAGDVNGDGKVDYEDLAIVASNWLEGTEP